MGRISRRAASIGESATLAIEARTKELVAAGEDVISFAAGEPDFPTPPYIVEAAQRACADARFHHYTPTAGLPELREALAAKTARDSGLHVSPSQVLVTNGGKQAVAHAFAVLLDPGDEVLVPAPYWVTYPEAVALAGGVCVPVATAAEAGFRVTVEQLEAARTSRTKVLLFVSPSNPTGSVYSRAEVEEIGRWAVEHQLWVVTDEIYEHLVYGTAQFHSMPVMVPELAARCIVVNGVAKTYAMTGWRVGWLIGPPDVTRAAINIQSHTTSHVANVSQRAALAAVTGGLDDVARMRQVFDRRRVRMQKGLAAISGVQCSEPQGAFYAFPSVQAYLSPAGETSSLTPASSSALAQAILEDARVAVVPGEAFGAPGHFRLSYALEDQLLDTGIARIAEYLGSRVPGHLPDRS